MKTAPINHYFVAREVHWLTSLNLKSFLGFNVNRVGKNKHFGLKEVNSLMKHQPNFCGSPFPPPLSRRVACNQTTNCTVRNLHAQYALKLNWQRGIHTEWIHSSVKCGWLWWIVFKTGGDWCWEQIVWKGMSQLAFVLKYQAVKTLADIFVFSPVDFNVDL